MSPVEQLLRDLRTILQESRLKYAVVGGMAVRAYGIPKPTYDVDFLISIEASRVPSLIEVIERAGYDIACPVTGIENASGPFQRLLNVTTIVEGRRLVADLFRAENAFQSLVLERRVHVEVNDFDFWIASVEDLILLKLAAHRYRDLADVLDVLTITTKLDKAYLDHWADKLRVTDKLATARKAFNEGR